MESDLVKLQDGLATIERKKAELQAAIDTTKKGKGATVRPPVSNPPKILCEDHSVCLMVEMD